MWAGHCHCHPPPNRSGQSGPADARSHHPLQPSGRTLVSGFCLLLIGIYRNSFSHIILHSCRFSPTCSRYAQEAIERYGALRGVYYTACRVLRCNPLFRGGVDPVK